MKQYGISSWLVQNLSADEAIETLAASGFKKVELSATDSELLQAWENDPMGIHPHDVDAAGKDHFIPELDASGFQSGRTLEISQKTGKCAKPSRATGEAAAPMLGMFHFQVG